MSTLGVKIDNLFKLREKKREAEAKVKDIASQIEEKEIELIGLMDDNGLTKSTGTKASISISSSVVPQVEDWDVFYKYIHRVRGYYLLERRPSTAACRELFEKKGAIPGVVPFTKRRLNLRAL